MNDTEPLSTADLEESAQGHDLFRAPGSDRLLEQARDQAEASGWLPPDVAADVPSMDVRRRISARRQRLHDAMRDLESAGARASGQPDWLEQVERATMRLHTAIDDHIAETEAPEGVLDDVLGHSPRLSADVEMLRRDHQRLRQACNGLLELARTSDPDTNELRRRILGVLGRLSEHRQLGAELLFDAYNTDLGIGD